MATITRAAPATDNQVILRALLTALAAVLFALGWIAGKIVIAVSWMGHAIKIGWTDAHRKRTRKT